MRRAKILLTSLVLMPLGLGCCITAGQCDCDPGYDPCYRYYAGPAHAPVATVAPGVEYPINNGIGAPPLREVPAKKVMPKVGE